MHDIIPPHTQDLYSFNSIAKWVEDVKEERGSNVIIYMIGNKIDVA